MTAANITVDASERPATSLLLDELRAEKREVQRIKAARFARERAAAHPPTPHFSQWPVPPAGPEVYYSVRRGARP